MQHLCTHKLGKALIYLSTDDNVPSYNMA